MQQILTTRASNLDSLLGGNGLPWDQEIPEAANTELPAVRRVEVGDRNAVLRELPAKAKEVRVKLRPFAQGMGDFLADDVLRVLPFGGLAAAHLDRNQTLQRAVEVDVGGHRNVQETLSLAEVQVGARALACGLQHALVVGGNAVEHPVDPRAVGAATFVRPTKGRVDRHRRFHITQTGLRWGTRVGVEVEQLKFVEPAGGGVGHSVAVASQFPLLLSSISLAKRLRGMRQRLPSSELSW